MPLSCSPAGTPRSGRAQQPRPSAIIPSILTRIGSESPRPGATSRSTRSSDSESGTLEPTPFSSTTSIFRLTNVRVPPRRLAGLHKGAGGGHPAQGLELLRASEPFDDLGRVDVGHFDGDLLKARLLQDVLVLLPLQGPRDAASPQPHRLQHRLRQVPLITQEDNIGDGEPATRLEDPKGLGNHLWFVGREVD